LSQRIRVLGAVLALLSLGIVLSACGSAQVAQNWPGLTLAGDTIYVISGLPQRVYMLDAETGGQKGTFVPQGEVKGTPYWSPVAVGGGLAFVGFADPQGGGAGLYAFDPETGQEQWQVPAESFIIPAPLYADGVVYFGSSDGLVYAVDVEARRVKPGWPFQAEEAIWATPLLVEERLYVAAQDHHLYCLDAETGEEIWQQKIGGAMAAQPVLDAASGILYVGAFDGKLYAIKADSGEFVEGFDFKAENWLWSEVLLEDDRLYVTSLDGRLYALDPSSGAIIPPYPYDSAQVDDSSDMIRAAPVRAKDLIVVGTQDGWVIATENALQQWIWPGGVPQTGVLTTPVVSGDTIYVVLMDGKVQALNAETGAQGWTFVPPESD
jgi:outer membrane protein assembly factor BamB